MAMIATAAPDLAGEKPPTGFPLSFLLSHSAQKDALRRPIAKLGFGATDRVREANLTRWRKRGLGSRVNEPTDPVMVWALARKPLDAAEGRA